MVRAGATRAPARGVTDLAIGSSDWLGPMRLRWCIVILLSRLPSRTGINLRLDWYLAATMRHRAFLR